MPSSSSANNKENSLGNSNGNPNQTPARKRTVKLTLKVNEANMLKATVLNTDTKNAMQKELNAMAQKMVEMQGMFGMVGLC